MDKLCILRPKAGRKTDEQVFRPCLILGLHRLDGVRIDVLHASAPARVNICESVMNGIIEDGSLTVCVLDQQTNAGSVCDHPIKAIKKLRSVGIDMKDS